MNLCLWEILVPVANNAGKEYSVPIHQEWDRQVRKITGGLTILKTAKGQWKSDKTGTIHNERMIPVRIACTEEQMLDIAKLTKRYYVQEAVMYYKVSDEVHFV